MPFIHPTAMQSATMLQELKEKLGSWRDDGWMEQCCANLAEQLRIAKAENAELQQEVEALRREHSQFHPTCPAAVMPSMSQRECLLRPHSSRGVRELSTVGRQSGI